MLTKNAKKMSEKSSCESCDFHCSKKSNYDKHLATAKHQYRENANKKMPKNAEFIETELCSEIKSDTAVFGFQCECKRPFKHLSSLSRHKKKCVFEEKEKEKEKKAAAAAPAPAMEIAIIDGSVAAAAAAEINNKQLLEIILEQAKNNNEFKSLLLEQNKIVMELVKKDNNNNNNMTIHNNTNCNNKQFNLQIFLNEECKDAMNMSDFMKSFNLQIADLEKVGKVGYVEGISDIIIQKLNEMDIYTRPMHCSDAKRETIYIKDNDIWEKEPPDNRTIKKVIRVVSQNNINVLREWKDLHTECMKSTSRQNDDYLRLIQQAVSGNEQTHNKVIKKIIREVLINKKGFQ